MKFNLGTLVNASKVMVLYLALSAGVTQAESPAPGKGIEIGSRLELFVDQLLVDKMEGVEFQLHHPQPMPIAKSPLIGDYATVVKDSDKKGVLYRAWYRTKDPDYTVAGKRHGGKGTGGPQELYRYAESRDGHEWTKPELNLFKMKDKSDVNNVIWTAAPFTHNLAPFLDEHPDCPPEERFKALAGVERTSEYYTVSLRKNGATDAELKRYGYTDGLPGGLFTFVSPDGIRWNRSSDKPVIPVPEGKAFDSQNVAFWSEAENQYVAYVRTWRDPHTGGNGIQNGLRTISRTTSSDFKEWSEPVAMEPNLPGEHLYTSQTHAYFRAPHIYISTPTRYMPDRGSSTDILFMTTRAGSTSYSRLFKDAFIRPGLSRDRWGNRSNYAARKVIPTSETEMSIYHAKSGVRHVLRTDGFVSVHAGLEKGELLTRPLVFEGDELILNVSTSAAGSLLVEVQDENGKPLPSLTLEDCTPIVGDSIEQKVSWKQGSTLGAQAGRPVRLRFVMRECDLYSLKFTHN
ncbi:hypothetical protein Pla110_08740 [Polystyrenella longa]|uniref:Glycosyl hydrolase family 32 N-terminal domain-containing protein n=1 Tax=Polystyrenella longa TaxID=2528007 RepID=A0A518CIV4_9PLAN|nr:hypothetical protein [Polystyrenella longa]QDU79169.1 hypothetical protein Pla110_08740 [Polystyrenella longa]